MFEVESKFHPMDSTLLQEYLDATPQTNDPSRIVDVYLDTENATLFCRGIFIRIRNGTSLELKFNREDIISQTEKGEHNVCSEHSFTLPLNAEHLNGINEVLEFLSLKVIKSPSLEELKRINDLSESITIDKSRVEYQIDRKTFCVDSVVGLGKFVEIEIICEDKAEVRGAIDEIQNLSRCLKLQLIDTGYNALFWRMNDYDIYRKSPYMMAVDREA